MVDEEDPLFDPGADVGWEDLPPDWKARYRGDSFRGPGAW
jgi:hypothetical protein